MKDKNICIECGAEIEYIDCSNCGEPTYRHKHAIGKPANNSGDICGKCGHDLVVGAVEQK